ncbi:unnamed protein product [Amoebophrya sp. A120]|nr:unnamed protein product [Amoebophrya sp. A120]|eukprot:GSA120T00000543001.1
MPSTPTDSSFLRQQVVQDTPTFGVPGRGGDTGRKGSTSSATGFHPKSGTSSTAASFVKTAASSASDAATTGTTPGTRSAVPFAAPALVPAAETFSKMSVSASSATASSAAESRSTMMNIAAKEPPVVAAEPAFERDTDETEEMTADEVWRKVLMPNAASAPLAFAAGYDQRLFDGWVKQPSPCCGAASVAGAWNALRNVHRSGDNAKDFRKLSDVLAKYCDALARGRRKRLDRILDGYLRCVLPSGEEIAKMGDYFLAKIQQHNFLGEEYEQQEWQRRNISHLELHAGGGGDNIATCATEKNLSSTALLAAANIESSMDIAVEKMEKCSNNFSGAPTSRTTSALAVPKIVQKNNPPALPVGKDMTDAEKKELPVSKYFKTEEKFPMLLYLEKFIEDYLFQVEQRTWIGTKKKNKPVDPEKTPVEGVTKTAAKDALKAVCEAQVALRCTVATDEKNSSPTAGENNISSSEETTAVTASSGSSSRTSSKESTTNAVPTPYFTPYSDLSSASSSGEEGGLDLGAVRVDLLTGHPALLPSGRGLNVETTAVQKDYNEMKMSYPSGGDTTSLATTFQNGLGNRTISAALATASASLRGGQSGKPASGVVQLLDAPTPAHSPADEEVSDKTTSAPAAVDEQKQAGQAGTESERKQETITPPGTTAAAADNTSSTTLQPNTINPSQYEGILWSAFLELSQEERFATELGELYTKKRAVARLTQYLPGTAEIGNWGILKACKRTGLDAKVIANRRSILGGKAVSAPGEEKRKEDLWNLLKANIGQPQTVLLFHLTNHYALLYCWREYFCLKPPGEEKNKAALVVGGEQEEEKLSTTTPTTGDVVSVAPEGRGNYTGAVDLRPATTTTRPAEEDVESSKGLETASSASASSSASKNVGTGDVPVSSSSSKQDPAVVVVVPKTSSTSANCSTSAAAPKRSATPPPKVTPRGSVKKKKTTGAASRAGGITSGAKQNTTSTTSSTSPNNQSGAAAAEMSEGKKTSSATKPSSSANNTKAGASTSSVPPPVPSNYQHVREIYTARKGQRPTAWLSLDEVYKILVGWSGYAIMKVTLKPENDPFASEQSNDEEDEADVCQ